MFDHVGVPVRDLEQTRAFYTTALAPLGIAVVMESPGAIGFGKAGKPQLWFSQQSSPPSGIHLAFSAANRAEVRAFHQAAIAAGGVDNGGPSLRPHYHPNDYGAFVFDSNGHNIEAVCHYPED